MGCNTDQSRAASASGGIGRTVDDFERLNAMVLNAHETGDTKTLVDVYHMLGAQELAENKVDAGCFLLTQAYVYALESGDPRSGEIHQILKDHGREE